MSATERVNQKQPAGLALRNSEQVEELENDYV